MEPEQPSLKTPCPATVHMALAISPWAPHSPTVPVITVMGQITHAMFISLLTLPGGVRGGTEEQREKPVCQSSEDTSSSVLGSTVDGFQSQEP